MSVQPAYETASRNRHAIQAFGSNPKKKSVRRLTLFLYPSTDQRRLWNKLLLGYMVIAYNPVKGSQIFQKSSSSLKILYMIKNGCSLFINFVNN